MCAKIEEIDVNDVFNRGMSIRENTVITYIDLMTDKGIVIWNELNAAERVGIILSFNLMLVKNGVDRRIVPYVKLNDDRIFIYN